MKLSLILSVLTLAGCTAIDTRETQPSASRNLSEVEVRELPSGTRFEDVEKCLRYFTRSAVAIPLISFVLEGEPDAECMMAYDARSGILRYAWIERKEKDTEVVWPKPAVGTKLLEIKDLFVDKKEK